MIGIDLVFIPEFKKQIDLGGDTFLAKAFNASELKNTNAEHLAGLWAAKESVVKAAESEPSAWRDIKIKYSNNKPWAVLGSESFDVSISHHGDYAIAVAMKRIKDEL